MRKPFFSPVLSMFKKTAFLYQIAGFRCGLHEFFRLLGFTRCGLVKLNETRKLVTVLPSRNETS
jgi:hypothetical protein